MPATKKKEATTTTTEGKSASTIVKCGSANCKSTFQDIRYGVGMRVHNRMKNGKRRCTGCTAVKD